jgi:2'-5' RNA ligase
LERLQSALLDIVPDCDDVVKISGRFVPHLSVGQVKGERTLIELLENLQADWHPLDFRVNEVSLIWRSEPPEDVFQLERTVRLGG